MYALVDMVDKGGLGVPDFQTMINTNRLKWVQKWSHGNETP
jgi:hypothetical protein